MKKLFSLIAIIVLTSCSDDVKFNNPGFQAFRDDILFKGIDVKAYQSTSGAITIQALAQDEEVNLSMASSAIGTYYLGTTNPSNRATYVSSFGDNDLSYATDPTSGSVARVEATMVSGGTSYTSDCTQQTGGEYTCGSSHTTTTTGSGIGLTVSLITNNGVVTSVRVASPGNNYMAGDLITVTGGDNNAQFRVLNVEGSNGDIVITENIGGTITGTFKFNAVKNNNNPFGNNVVNFQYGAFYKIPLIPAP
jgi:hypothetical protein